MSNNVIFQLELDIRELRRVNEGLKVRISQLEKELQSKIAQKQDTKTEHVLTCKPQSVEALKLKEPEPTLELKNNGGSKKVRYNK